MLGIPSFELFFFPILPYAVDALSLRLCQFDILSFDILLFDLCVFDILQLIFCSSIFRAFDFLPFNIMPIRRSGLTVCRVSMPCNSDILK